MTGRDTHAGRTRGSIVPAPRRAAAIKEDFRRLYDDAFPIAYGYAAARVGSTDAEDIVADVFYAAARKVRDDGGDVPTPAWIVAATKNKVIDHWRRNERRARKLHLLRGGVIVGDPSVDTTERDQVLRCLDRLNPRHRTLLLLHHLDGLSVAELADLTGTTYKAIESTLQRARHNFRDTYETEEAARGRS